MFAGYKAGRKSKGEEFSAWRTRTVMALAKLFTCMKSEGWEADDVIATVARKYESTHKVYTFTRDKDCMQLVNDSVTQIDWMNGTIYDLEKVALKFGGWTGNKIVEYLAYVGDSADAIKGVTGIGPKKVDKYLAGEEELTPEQQDEFKAAMELVKLYNVPLETIVEEELVEEKEEVHPHVADALEAIEGAKSPITVAGHEEVLDAPLPPAVTPRPVENEVKGNDEIELRPGLVLSNARIDVLQRLAKGYDRGGLYARHGDSTTIFTILMMGVELGISSTAMLNGVHVMTGKLVMGAHLLIGLARRDKTCEYFDCSDADETQATYVCKKVGRDKEMTFTYTMDDANNDGMSWARKMKNRKAMLRKTAGLQAARLWFPEATSGLYGDAEMGIDSDD
jgi:hypothetical protein